MLRSCAGNAMRRACAPVDTVLIAHLTLCCRRRFHPICLHVGVLKLGRFIFDVRQMVASADDGTQPILRLDYNDSSCLADTAEDAASHPKVCRICLLEGPGEGDPLVAPCSCTGSIAYVHLGCLREWIRNYLNLPEEPLCFVLLPASILRVVPGKLPHLRACGL